MTQPHQPPLPPEPDQSTWPAQGRDGAPSQRCNRCGRNTWTLAEFGGICGVWQPSGSACDGRFEATP